MIGLRSREWDVIIGALLCNIEAEWSRINEGCECSDECDQKITYTGCYDQTQIDILKGLTKKAEMIRKTMDYFEMEVLQ